MGNKFLLTVVILSYNRPKQIKRILQNLISVNSDDFCLIIKDDKSPSLNEIEAVYSEFKNVVSFDLQLISNAENLGYDKNLLDAFNVSNSYYLMLLSDDDFLNGSEITRAIEILKKKEYPLYFSPYRDLSSNCFNRIVSSKTYASAADIDYSSIVYNSILFSGLVFDVENVLSLKLDKNFLSNCIYTQVYLSVSLIFQSRSFGSMPKEMLVCGGDGENFFGKNQSAQNIDLLKDRKSVESKLNYQTFLIKTVERIGNDTTRKVFSDFLREYNKRLFAYALWARGLGRSNYSVFHKSYLESKIPKSILHMCIFRLLYLVPDFVSAWIYAFGVNKLKKSG